MQDPNKYYALLYYAPDSANPRGSLFNSLGFDHLTDCGTTVSTFRGTALVVRHAKVGIISIPNMILDGALAELIRNNRGGALVRILTPRGAYKTGALVQMSTGEFKLDPTWHTREYVADRSERFGDTDLRTVKLDAEAEDPERFDGGPV